MTTERVRDNVPSLACPENTADTADTVGVLRCSKSLLKFNLEIVTLNLHKNGLSEKLKQVTPKGYRL